MIPMHAGATAAERLSRPGVESVPPVPKPDEHAATPPAEVAA